MSVIYIYGCFLGEKPPVMLSHYKDWLIDSGWSETSNISVFMTNTSLHPVVEKVVLGWVYVWKYYIRKTMLDRLGNMALQRITPNE
jgi:hypothetical protein